MWMTCRYLLNNSYSQALLIFLLNYVANIGSFLGIVFPALLTLVHFDTPTPFLLTTRCQS